MLRRSGTSPSSRPRRGSLPQYSRQRLVPQFGRFGLDRRCPEASTSPAQQRPRGTVTAAEMARDLFTGCPMGGHEQGNPGGHRQRRKGDLELMVVLAQNGDGVRLGRPVGPNQTGREPARDGRATRPADDEIRACPVARRRCFRGTDQPVPRRRAEGTLPGSRRQRVPDRASIGEPFRGSRPSGHETPPRSSR